MEIKPNPNQAMYLQILQRMTPEQRLAKAFKLSMLTKVLFLQGLRNKFSDNNETEIQEIYLDRITKCYNRNY